MAMPHDIQGSPSAHRRLGKPPAEALLIPDSLLSGDNAVFLDQQYRSWLDDPSGVDAEWSELFATWDRPSGGGGRSPEASGRSIFHGGGDGSVSGTVDIAQVKVAQLINAYRVRGHMVAQIDPLGRRERVTHPELELSFYGLTEADLDRTFSTSPLFGMPEQATLRDIMARCRKAYCGTLGAEFMNVLSMEQKLWVQEQLETLPDTEMLNREQEKRVLRKLSDAENFEQLLHQRFPGTKRFSLEGGETLIPLLDLTLEHAANEGVDEFVIGMAHRGRLSVLCNIFEKPFNVIVSEFEDTRGVTPGSGDVKYHLGYSADVTTARGDEVHLSLCFNPSHLEAVDPVAEGRVRAKQERRGDSKHHTVMPILLHGDAAFAGQGLVAEVLNLSELDGYKTGGTIHVIVNNQIGFTTRPHEARSTPYATDVARMLAVPIFHVNGEDPRSVAACVRLAVAWRQKYHRDAIIDMLCFRKHGHNEGDEPSFTQPLMYNAIRRHPTPREHYASFLKKSGYLDDADVNGILADSRQAFEDQVAAAGTATPTATGGLGSKGKPDVSAFDKAGAATNVLDGGDEVDTETKNAWASHLNGDALEVADTTIDKATLVQLLTRANTLPESFSPHAKIKRLLKQRLEIVDEKRPVDWAIGEQAAFATLVAAGLPVRLSGQDSGRGTFSHRHAVITDVKTGAEYFPLQHIAADQGRFVAIDSLLSEAAVLGFEYGYSLDSPETLVVWEAQFGDFVNGAQVIIDQFITSTETKWQRLSGLTLLLPHGYEGQGPEHSSAKLERFLNACAEDNIQVANCTTPANFFHLLRRQVLRRVRKPLVVMSPKSLLRHPKATSTLDDLAQGAFQRVYDDTTVKPKDVKRVVLCSGKLYYELLAAREERGQNDVALVRIELLYPFPADLISAVLDRFSGAEVVWAQEEPKNMGAWPSYLHWFYEHLGAQRIPRYVGRDASASPATGSNKVHHAQQAKLVSDALTLRGS
ncbi:MAG: 2-oxoglutarate dehydrogenase E1 component [Myxococcota bacterium]|jgi:2-oxoglutarate dehydrogenase E1 component